MNLAAGESAGELSAGLLCPCDQEEPAGSLVDAVHKEGCFAELLLVEVSGGHNPSIVLKHCDPGGFVEDPERGSLDEDW